MSDNNSLHTGLIFDKFDFTVQKVLRVVHRDGKYLSQPIEVGDTLAFVDDRPTKKVR